MSVISTTLSPDDLFRLSVKQYHELIDSGALASDEPVELIEGILFRKMSKNPPQSSCNGKMQKVIAAAIGPGWCFRLQGPWHFWTVNQNQAVPWRVAQLMIMPRNIQLPPISRW
jgi:hypothetical protein